MVVSLLSCIATVIEKEVNLSYADELDREMKNLTNMNIVDSSLRD